MSYLADSLSEDDLIAIAGYLSVPDVIRLSAVSLPMRTTLLRSRHLWRSAAVALLGESKVGLHLTAWKESDTPRFYRRLVRAGRACEELAYANSLRREVVDALPPDETLKQIVMSTGHTATACGPGLVAVIGGWRANDMSTHLHVFVVDVVGRAMRVPALHDTSSKPMRRMRHASCAVATPSWANLPAGSPSSLPSVLVLGGACDGGGGGPGSGSEPPPVGEERGDPVRGGLLELTLLSFCDTDGSVVRWQAAQASGAAPATCWHHQCAAFSGGTKAVVFGGDFRPSDAEFAHIEPRGEARHVYVLDVGARLWERVATTGSHPSWRSLHVGLACHPPPPEGASSGSAGGAAGGAGGGSAAAATATGGEAMLILGGSDEHVQPFSSGDCADFKPYLLDLETFAWRTTDDTPESGVGTAMTEVISGEAAAEDAEFMPASRMRFAAEAYGHHVLLYSGHGDRPIPPGASAPPPPPLSRRVDHLFPPLSLVSSHVTFSPPLLSPAERTLRLDLRTLTWRRMRVRDAPSSLPDTPAACLAGGAPAWSESGLLREATAGLQGLIGLHL